MKSNLTSSLVKPSDGPDVASFIEKFCTHSIGDIAGQKIQLRNFQKEILDGLFETNEQGLWVHKTGLVFLPRKNAKSQLGSGIALYALVSGEQGAEVYAAAGSRDQARRVFDEAKKMVQANPALSKGCKLYRNSIEYKKTGSVFKVLSSDAGLQHGLNPYVAIIDETHVHPNGDLAEALSSGRGARKESMIVHITTPGAGQNIYLWELLERAKRAQEDGDSTFYLYWNPPADGCDYKDKEVWKAVNPAVGDWITEEYLESQTRELPESEFRRLHLCQWTQTKEAWLPFGAWDDLAESAIEDGEAVFVGLDGSWSNDSTGIVLCTPDGRIDVFASWEKPINDVYWRVPFNEVEDKIYEALKRYNVIEVVADPYWISNLLQKLEAEGFPVVEYATNSVARMVPACSKFLNGIMDKKINHSHNKSLARHLDNCRIKSDASGVRIVKESKGSPNKIDLAVCAVIAYDRASQWVEPAKKVFRVY